LCLQKSSKQLNNHERRKPDKAKKIALLLGELSTISVD